MERSVLKLALATHPHPHPHRLQLEHSSCAHKNAFVEAIREPSVNLKWEDALVSHDLPAMESVADSHAPSSGRTTSRYVHTLPDHFGDKLPTIV